MSLEISTTTGTITLSNSEMEGFEGYSIIPVTTDVECPKNANFCLAMDVYYFDEFQFQSTSFPVARDATEYDVSQIYQRAVSDAERRIHCKPKTAFG